MKIEIATCGRLRHSMSVKCMQKASFYRCCVLIGQACAPEAIQVSAVHVFNSSLDARTENYILGGVKHRNRFGAALRHYAEVLVMVQIFTLCRKLCNVWKHYSSCRVHHSPSVPPRAVKFTAVSSSALS